MTAIGSLMVVAAVFSLFPASFDSMPKGQSESERRLVLQPAAGVTALPSKAKRWALIIGVDRYRDGQISPLRGAANDARALAGALIQYAGFPADQVLLLASDQPEERQPTRVNVLRRLSNLKSLVPSDGLLFVSFAGHGIERNGQAFLLPSDAQISEDVTFLEDTAVSVSRMREGIKATGVKQVLLLLDACRNDPTGRADAPNVLTEGYTRGFNFDLRNREVNAFAVLYATEVGKRAFEYTEKRQGYFTWAVVDAMRGNAANQTGEVTLGRLVEYVQETVAKRTQIDLGAGKIQRPFANIQGYKANELVLAVSDPRAAASGATMRPSETMPFELTFWNSIKESTNPADFRDYIDRYPEGEFAGVARRRIESLESARRSTTAAPARENPTRPANVFDLRHAHQSFTKLRFATATVTVTAQGIRYNEVGQDVKSDHDLSFSCAEFKEAKFEAFRNAQELKDISGFDLRDAVKLSIRSTGKLDQAFTERAVAEAILVAIRDSCGIRTSTRPTSTGWAVKK